MNQFQALGLDVTIASAIEKLGILEPTEVQREAIKPLLAGQDVIAQAKTGTGKTLAFGGPALACLDLEKFVPQVLILAPTRELAIQVAEALQSYAANLKNLKVLPIYGGQDYRTQLRGLKQGAQIIVGTPGRVIDHLDRQSLDLSEIKLVVLDEADEMLNMGFIDDVEKILEATPKQAQRALFSATLPTQIKKMSDRYLKNPTVISIKAQDRTTSQIEQFFAVVFREHKFEALARFLATEHGTATIIFARTKSDTLEIAEKLEAYGYKVSAINGDMNQALREKVISRLKSADLDVVVATDVAARGLDVERIDYVINYDIPFDPESYVHRIGRTGRAGRAGRALVLVSPRELRTLRDFQRVTGYDIKEIQPPTKEQVQAVAEKSFCAELLEIKSAKNFEVNSGNLKNRLASIQASLECSVEDLASVLLLKLDAQRKNHFSELQISQSARSDFGSDRSGRSDRGDRGDRRSRDFRGESRGESRGDFRSDSRSEPRSGSGAGFNPRVRRSNESNSFGSKSNSNDFEPGMTRCEMNFGRDHGITPSDIVGLITNRCNINRKLIGRIDISQESSHIDLAEDVAHSVVSQLSNAKFKRRDVTLRVS